MNNMERVIREYRSLLLKTIEKREYLRNLYNKKLNLYYTSKDGDKILKEVEILEKEINNLNETINILNNFINESVNELVNGLDTEDKKLFYIINGSNYLYFSLLNHFKIIESNKINNRNLNVYKLVKMSKINGFTLVLEVFTLLEKLGFNMNLEGTNFIGHLICENISPSENLSNYNIVNNYTNKRDIILSMEYSAISVNLDNRDEELFSKVFLGGISTNYKDIIKEVSNYLKKEHNKKTLKN